MINRIATLGDYHNYYSYFLYGTMEGAIRNGCWFRPVPLFGQSLDEIKKQLWFFKPHILFCHMIFNKRPHDREKVFQLLRDLRKELGTFVCYHMGDARDEPRYPHDISDFVDLGLVNHGLSGKFSNIWKIPCIYWPYPCLYQKEIRKGINPLYETPLAFTGSFSSSEHHKDRMEFIHRLRKYIDIKIFPTPETGNTRFQTDELATSAGGVLGYQMGRHIPLYLDVRPFQYMGAGALYFHDESTAMDELFDDGIHYISYKRNDVDDFLEKYNRIKKDKTHEIHIRENAFKTCQLYHSTKVRVRVVIDYVKGFNTAHQPLKYYYGC